MLKYMSRDNNMYMHNYNMLYMHMHMHMYMRMYTLYMSVHVVNLSPFMPSWSHRFMRASTCGSPAGTFHLARAFVSSSRSMRPELLTSMAWKALRMLLKRALIACGARAPSAQRRQRWVR